jgi:3'-phosphoadenosine 5'-phosphosulfate sulfotransferase (PAPS reductase)/FAD synthetase
MSEEDFYLVDLKSRFDKIKPNEYYLSYSGGKDSHFLYWFIKEYLKRDDIKIVGINTYMEHHEIRDRIIKNSDIVLFPEIKPMEVKAKYGSPCFSKIQDDFIDKYQRGSRCKSIMERIQPREFVGKDGKVHRSSFALSKKASELLLSGKLHRVSPKCCKILKKNTAHKFEKESGLKAILGVRGDEGAMRKTQYKSCFTKDKKFTPLWDLSDELMEKIIKKYNIEVPKVYNHIKRTGCMGCPYGSYKHDTEKELMLIDDAQFNFVCEYFKESYEVLGIDVEKIRKERDNKQIELDI